MHFLISACFIAGFIDAIVGGGGMVSLPALLALGLPPHMAVATNKAVGISTATAGSIKYIRAKTVRWEGLKTALPVAFVFGIVGALLTTLFSPTFLKQIIFVALISVALILLFNRNIGARIKKPILTTNFLWTIALILGVYDGFFGPGIGTFMVIGLVQLWGFNLLQSAGTGRVINLASTIGSTLTFAYLGQINYLFIWPGMIAAFIGGHFGATYSVKFGNKGIRPMLFLIVFGLLIKLAFSLHH